ncbi:MAG: hypothetical protein RLZZ271_101 [Pseudomonadota bacterium]|jgi:uncharacterized protein YycO
MRKFIDQSLLVLASVFVPLLFLAYRYLVSLLVALLGVAIVYSLIWWLCPAGFTHTPEALRYWRWVVYGLAVLILLPSLALAKRDNPYRKYVGLGGFFNKVIDSFIAWIGTIKYFTQPLSLIQDPGSYKISGKEARELIDHVLQPGDILLRGYKGYLDGIMIGLTGGGDSVSKHFSHAAFYVGDLDDARDKAIVARRLQVVDDAGHWVDADDSQKDKVRNDTAYYEQGPQRVIHAMTKGVFTEDILTFLRCDYLAVLRLPTQMTLTAEEQRSFSQNLETLDKQDAEHKKPVGAVMIDALAPDALSVQQQLLAGQTVTREQVLDCVHRSALGKIGSCYDFQFTDGKTHNRFSCSEFVYYCFKSVHSYIGLRLIKHGFLGMLFVRESITPGDIFDAAMKHKKLQVVWTSKSLQA